MDRRWENIPAEKINSLAQGLKPESYASDWMSDAENFQYADSLLGRELTLIFPEGKIRYSFFEKKKLKLSLFDEILSECFYRAVEEPGHPELIFVHHYLDGNIPAACIDLVLDFDTGFAVCVYAKIGHPSYPREVSHKIYIGEIEGIEHPLGSLRPKPSTELVGKAIMWDMPGFTKKPPIKHIYLSSHYYAIAMTRPDGSCFISADPADYIKIKENVFLVSAIEERRSGIQLTFLINTELLEDLVGHFGISAGNEIGQDEPRIVCTLMTGRKGKWAPMETVF